MDLHTNKGGNNMKKSYFLELIPWSMLQRKKSPFIAKRCNTMKGYKAVYKKAFLGMNY